MVVERQDEKGTRLIQCEWCNLKIAHQDGRYNVGDLSYHPECYARMRKGDVRPPFGSMPR